VRALTGPLGAPASRATSSTGIPTRWCSTVARTPLRALRHRLAAIRHATVRTQAAGSSARRTCCQCCQARAYASWVQSWASAGLPVHLVEQATVRRVVERVEVVAAAHLTPGPSTVVNPAPCSRVHR
jgi:hypothetical protein